MSKVFIVGDFHFGHRNILKYRPQFKTIEEHDQFIIDNFNKTIKKRDTVYFTGDIFFTDEGLKLLSKLRFCNKKILILGNHDGQFFKGNKKDYYNYFDDIKSSVKKKGCWITHIPISTEELRGSYNIHAHTHYHNLDDTRYFNTSLENINFTPIDLIEVVEKLQKDNPEYELIRQNQQKQKRDGTYQDKIMTPFKENNYNKK